MESLHCFRLVPSPDRVRDGEKIGPGADQRRAVFRGYPAYRDAGDLEDPLPPGEQLRLGTVIARLGFARVESAERHIVRARLSGFHRQVAAGMARYPDLRFAAENLASIAHVSIALSQVHAVGLEAPRQSDAVVDDEGAVVRRADFLQGRRKPCGLVLIKAFHAKLKRRHFACLERTPEPIREYAADIKWRYEIETTTGHRSAVSVHSGGRKGEKRVKASMKIISATLAPFALAACVVVPEPYSTPPAPEGAAVALGQSVRVGEVSVTPISVVEDSRCPINARCVWAGRLVVETRIDGQTVDGPWRDRANIRLGETYGTHGQVIALVSGEPGKTKDRETRPEEYRFTYEAGWNVKTDPGPPYG